MYTCPMHRKVTSDKPGVCPKCGMTLREVPELTSKNDDTLKSHSLYGRLRLAIKKRYLDRK